MKVLFATAELAPLVRVGGLSYAAAGLVRQLHADGIEVTVVVPDYGTFDAGLGAAQPLDMPGWVGITTVREGIFGDGVPLLAVRTPAIERPHPYNDEAGQGWHDNDFRFMAFSAAVARLVDVLDPDVVHLNDWHTGAALGMLSRHVPSVFTIHNLAYQGMANAGWAGVLHRRPEAYEWHGIINPMSGAIALADRVVAVSPNYVHEIRRPEGGFGLDGPLRARGENVLGILNGIDTEQWNPATDGYMADRYDTDDLSGKAAARRSLLVECEWATTRHPVIAMVTRLTHQKGVDLALDMIDYLDHFPAKLVILGSGDRELAERAHWATVGRGDVARFVEGYDEAMSHRLFAGADLLLMPSRFEPCGLAQMQAMIYGTIPMVTDVGGLHDTVVDADLHGPAGNGFVAGEVTPMALLDTIHRATRAWRSPSRRRTIQLRGMRHDWSWRDPARRHIELYRNITSG
ncbi:MAG: glycogen/starch synthase [Acidimicrobiia bacterium]|nr:glycogen/starch synthase [Acidimicrobiia bacterium]